MSYLDVEGASLYYETAGSGPVLLCIAGASGSVEYFKPLAEQLKDRFTVVMYDRRGFSRSHLTGAQDYANRLTTDASDAAALLTHLSASTPASVLGSSSGAIVALHLLTTHPSLILTLIAHEPPAHRLLPDYEEIAAGSAQLYALYRAQGIIPALDAFAGAVRMSEGERVAMQAAMDARTGGPWAFSNAMYWFEREVLAYPGAELDVEALGREKGKLVLVCGMETDEGAGHFRPNVVLGERLGLEVKKVDGGHLGAVSHAEGFAEGVGEVLKGR